jgi:hypothetical protein
MNAVMKMESAALLILPTIEVKLGTNMMSNPSFETVYDVT